MEVEYLKSEIAASDFLEHEIHPSTIGVLASMLQDIVPEELYIRRMKGYVKKAARLCFARYLVGREVSSFKQLKDGEILRMIRWLNGTGPCPHDHKSEEYKVRMAEERRKELAQWYRSHKKEIQEFAYEIKAK